MRGPGGEGSFPTPGICSEQGQQHRGGGSSSLAAPDAAAARSIMSRRKQAKPQHLHSEDQDPAARDGELKECRFDGDGTVSAKRFKMEEAHVCERCSAEFFDLSQFIQHKKSCTKSPPILLMRDSPEALGTEGFTESSLSPFLNDTDSRSLNDFQSVSPQNPGELVKEEMSPTPITSDEGAYPKSDEGAYPKSDEGAYSKLDYPKSDEGAYSKLDYPKSDEGAYSKLDYPKSDERAYSKLDYPKSDERAYPKSTPPPAPTPPAPSYIPKAKVPNTNVTLQTIHATKVAVNQHTADTISASSVSLNAIPMILEQLVCLQQQQLQQIQLTEQIRIQIAMMAPHALNPSIAASSDPLKALGAHLSQQLAAAVALIGQKAGNQSLSLETLRQSKVPPPNMGLPSAGTRPTGHSASSFNPDAARLIQSGVSRFPHSVLPQSPRSVISQNPLSSMAAAVDSSRKGKPPNISVPENRSSTDESFFKHKCRFCGKVFGNDSALQIHLRSHTGERPFKCNICGNRFTTKGNLKVHFQRHKEKYPHIRMNPYPVPEHLDNVPTPNGIPYGMSVPLDESNVLADIKPVITTMPLGLNLSQTAPLITGVRDSINGALANHLQSRPSSGSEGGSSSGTTSHDSLGEQPNRNSSQLNGMYNGFNTNGQASETSKLQQLVENIDKSSRDPNECLICHRVLSCQSSLKMHYRIHTGERPYKCKLCGRAFSTKGNLKTHYGVHRANTPLKMQHSCPICHKKFTNAVVLQQHIRMHMGGQIPNTPLPEGVGESSNLEGESPNKKRELTNGTIDEPMENRTDPAESPEVQSPLPKLPTPKSENKSESSPTIFSSIAALEQQIKIVNSSLNLQRQNSMKSSEVGSPESDGMTNDSFSSLEIDLEFQNGRSPSASESTLFPAPSPSNSQHEKRTSKSPEFNRQDFKVGLPSTSRSSEDRSLNHPMDHPFGNLMDRPLGNLMDRPLGNLMDHSLRSPVDHNIEKRMENSMDHSMYPEGDGALDLTSTNFGRRAIKEEPGLYFSNEDYGSFLRVPPALVKTEAPSDRPFGDRPHSSMQLGSQPTPSPGSSPHMVSVRRSAKQHICNTCGKNFSSASALQIHERTHTGEKPFACTICGRAFTTKGNLKVHVGTHMWNNSARRGRRLSIDNPTPVLGNDARIPDLFPKDMVPPSMNLDPVMWNQYAAVLTSGLAMKTNEISVIQGGSIPALPVSLGGGSVVRGASVNVDGSQSGMSHNSMSRTGMGHTLSEMEKVGVENLQKRPFPRFMEEKNIAVS